MKYPTVKSQQEIEDEYRYLNDDCECEHKRFAHEDTWFGLAKGHGRCMNTKCDCIKFTWKPKTSDKIKVADSDMTVKDSV